MTDKTFKIPLVGPKKNVAAPKGVFDYAAIGKEVRARFPNPFGIAPDEKLIKCDVDATCPAVFNGVLWMGGCTGKCSDQDG